MPCVSLKYGNATVHVPLPTPMLAEHVVPRQLAPLAPLEEAVTSALECPVESNPFEQVFRAGDKVTIIVSDITRKTRSDLFLPLLVDQLNRQGIPDKDLVILIATGTHRPATDDEKTRICSGEICERVSIVSHSCDDSDLVYLGTTPRGTEVHVNRLAVERKLLLTGAIAFHPLAGFSGGRKSIVPGVAGHQTIHQNHALGLDPTRPCLNPSAGNGLRSGNPAHLDMVDCARLLEPAFLFNSVIDPSGKIVHVVAGHWLHAWEAGCQWVADHVAVPPTERAGLVLASAGGYPRDISLYQVSVSLANAAAFVQPGGTLVMFAECREGLGPDDFLEWMEPLARGTLYDDLRTRCTNVGYIFCLVHEACQIGRVVLLSKINPELTRTLGIIGVETVADALRAAGIAGHKSRALILPEARVTVPHTT